MRIPRVYEDANAYKAQKSPNRRSKITRIIDYSRTRIRGVCIRVYADTRP